MSRLSVPAEPPTKELSDGQTLRDLVGGGSFQVLLGWSASNSYSYLTLIRGLTTVVEKCLLVSPPMIGGGTVCP